MEEPMVVRMQVGHGRSVRVRVGTMRVSRLRRQGSRIVVDVRARIRRRSIAWGLARLGHPVVALRYLMGAR